jgi:hypothetical protein
MYEASFSIRLSALLASTNSVVGAKSASAGVGLKSASLGSIDPLQLRILMVLITAIISQARQVSSTPEPKNAEGMNLKKTQIFDF